MSGERRDVWREIVLGVLVLLGVAACGPSGVANGALKCGTGSQCPSGYYCEPLSQTCWKNGAAPDLASGDLSSLDSSVACGGDEAPCCANDDCLGQANCVSGVCHLCGALNQPCCTEGCFNGTACSNNMCVTCGGLNQPCCPDGSCTASGAMCNASAGGTCVACAGCVGCGDDGPSLDVCCGTGNRCPVDQSCVTSGSSSACMACGAQGESCCRGSCNVFTLTCSGGGCLCGAIGQHCCAEGNPCPIAGSCNEYGRCR